MSYHLLMLFTVSELQEEGMNAINLPLSPTPFELDPEDTMLGNLLQCQSEKSQFLSIFSCNTSTSCG